MGFGGVLEGMGSDLSPWQLESPLPVETSIGPPSLCLILPHCREETTMGWRASTEGSSRRGLGIRQIWVWSPLSALQVVGPGPGL